MTETSIQRQTRALTRRAAWLLLVASLPLLLLILGLGILQYVEQRRILLGDIARQTDDRHTALEALLAAPVDHIARLKAFMEERLADDIGRGPTPFRQFLRYEAPMIGTTRMEGFYTDHLRADLSSDFSFVLADAKLVETLGPAYGEFDAALDLVEPMRLGHLTSRSLQWSYYFSQSRLFSVIYPGAPAEETLAASVAAGGHDVRSLLASWNEYDIFQLGTPRADPERKPYWTGVYLDAAGAGRMVTHGAPIYRQDRFLGIVATDVTLETFAKLLQNLSQTPGTIAIANERGQVLAARNAATGENSTPDDLTSLLPSGLATRPTVEILTPSESFRSIDGTYILAQRAAAEPFWLIHVVSEAELLRQLLPRFAPVGLILLSLLVTLAVAIIILGRHLVRPGLMLVRHIQAETQDEPQPAAPAPPAVWRPWFDAVSHAFASARLYQKRLEASEAEYRAVVETQTEFVVRFLPDNRVLFTNDAYCRHIGVSREQLLGATTDQYLRIEPSDLARLRKNVAALTRENPTTWTELRVIMPDGRVCWEEWTDTGIFDDEGKLVATQAVGRDLTERKATALALERQREALHQSEKLAALGSMLAGVAHELNNPLSVVIGYAGMLAELAESEPMRERAAHVQAAAERCARIVKAFLAMARAKPSERRRVALAEVLDDALKLTSYGLRTHSVTIENALPGDLPPVNADRDQLHQVFLNLIVNAQHALALVPGPRRIRITGHAEAGDVVIAISDNGPGMDAEVQRRAFEPFFTTKPQGMGTGIGLAVSRGIVEAHGGSLTLASSVGRGATFTVRLPAAPSAQSPDVEFREPFLPRSLSGQILVVDDEEELAELIAERLAGDGLEIDIATSGAAAIELIRARAYDVLITDLRMPDMDGAQLIAEVERIAPALLHRSIVVTGDALGAELDAAITDRRLPVLEKPLDFDTLRGAVRRLLRPDGPQAALADEAKEAAS
ncbi:response regulator [Inquilinus limosus]|uniref:ATP-binding protein n=1 Tax=Inquilinus limosus TaxID=171674 RepID=UPI003F15F906